MKAIINGKKYNTETARLVGEYEKNRGNFSYIHEELYKKKTGEFFIWGEGGPSSKYSEPCGLNCWTGSADIIPLTEDEAKEWAENHLSVDEYETIFGEVEE